MAIGLPAVVTDVVGNRDVVSHAKTGFVAASQAELQHYVAELAQNDARRIQMGQSAKEVARERFGLPRLLDRWKQIYEGPDS
jgi:glycosyltransferase involved in cell wall biosynthesis